MRHPAARSIPGRPPSARPRGPASLACVALTAVFAAGCFGERRPPATMAGSVAPRSVSIHVENREFNDATVYISRAGTQLRLGIVGGKDERVFRRDWTFPDIQLRVDFVGGGGFTTQPLPVSPGDELELIIQVGSQSFGRR